MCVKLSELALVLTLLFGLVSCNRTNAGGVQGTGTTGKIAKWSNSMTITDSAINESNGNVGIGVSTPGEKLHIADGNLLIEGGREQAVIMKLDQTFTGGPSGPSVRPVFQLGRIVQAGDLDPEFRV